MYALLKVAHFGSCRIIRSRTASGAFPVAFAIASHVEPKLSKTYHSQHSQLLVERFGSDRILKARIKRLSFHVIPQRMVWEWPVVRGGGVVKHTEHRPFEPLAFPTRRGACDRASILDLEDLGRAGQVEGGEGSLSKGKAEDDKSGAEHQAPCGGEEENRPEIVSLVQVRSAAT
jgi:hypothetical protein